VLAAAATTAPARLEIAKTLLLNVPGDPTSRTDHWNKDIRDPVIFDPTLTVARFVRAAPPNQTIATVVNWADHPEMSAFGPNNLMVSAHFIHHVREVIEDGVPAGWLAPIDGIGGVTVYVQGALGGQIGSIRDAPVPGRDGTPITASGHPKEEALGVNVGRRALEILRDEAETVTELPLSYRTARFHARIDNTGFQAAFLLNLLAPHPLAGWDPAQPVDVGNEPWIPMRATYLQVGPLALITVPGELHPELWVGGYDGSWSWGWPLLDADKPNSPDLSTAPMPPYLRDLMLANPGVRYPLVAGLAMDYCGYIVPRYNYVLSTTSPYLDEADGDHYEETYSLGPDVERHVVHPCSTWWRGGRDRGAGRARGGLQVRRGRAGHRRDARGGGQPRGRRRLVLRRHPLRRDRVVAPTGDGLRQLRARRGMSGAGGITARRRGPPRRGRPRRRRPRPRRRRPRRRAAAAGSSPATP
jgi:hypothetical protein